MMASELVAKFTVDGVNLACAQNDMPTLYHTMATVPVTYPPPHHHFSQRQPSERERKEKKRDFILPTTPPTNLLFYSKFHSI